MKTRTSRGAVLMAVACVGWAGCTEQEPSNVGSGGAGGTDTTSSTSSGTGGAPPVAEVSWSACPLYVDQPDGPAAECATIEVPLRWSEPDGPTIGIFVQRLRGTSPARGQLWLLEGGPGGSGADFDAWMEQMRALDPTLDLYAVDHRGVGRSARLGCPEQEAPSSEWGISVSSDEAAACQEALVAVWGDDLAEFTTTAAARDLGRLIELTEEPEQDVFVYGVSYGTYWAHRYLQVEPNQATAVVLDSIAPPGIDFVQYDADFDAVAQDYMALCAADALCSSKLGADPWAAVVNLTADLEAGHCPELTASWGLDGSALRLVLAVLVMDPVARVYLPSLVYRYGRCDAADVAAIEQMLSVLFGGPQATSYYDTLSSDALFYNVALSELWPNADAHPTKQEVDDVEAGLYVTTGLSVRVAEVQDAWVAYADDRYVDAWASSDTPLLMMNGDLDPLTPIWSAELAGQHFTGRKQQFFTIPRAAHAVTATTPVAVPGDTPCGFTLLINFLKDPNVPTDSTCLGSIPAESFAGVAANNLYLLGTPDLWENDMGANASASEMPASLRRSLSDVRRRLRRQAMIVGRVAGSKRGG